MMDREKVPEVVLRQMTLEDVDGVLAIEKASFTTPWSRGAFIKEVTENKLAYYTVAELEGEIAGYAGVWLIVDEGHITNIAVAPKYRGRNLGKKILEKLIQELKNRKILRVTLEVRASNDVAINLYKSYGFIVLGRRPGYYTDNGEDALIMWKDLTREI
ncbi:ribosomal protein S18-alanine N-acetyltransferase [Isachenkonia alkalipeptolytica]|uniref:Ribosomal-protein-alanine N-acetyltransferase n=1 Tax=Isachenkonia alkalipeptolytica TaxID=2565777 RepID=A0AA43XPH0_9CLOT|nr:ribosomal protein S18-alanine N-acetyltransferase [Isachenkonia alkalipeptolytica]NBG89375.1 ribosomal-protein-alanine N-acetyltransferase [Isachenkonia alkalipeptolytica]